MDNLLHLKFQDNTHVRPPQHLKIRLGIQNQGNSLNNSVHLESLVDGCKI